MREHERHARQEQERRRILEGIDVDGSDLARDAIGTVAGLAGALQIVLLVVDIDTPTPRHSCRLGIRRQARVVDETWMHDAENARWREHRVGLARDVVHEHTQSNALRDGQHADRDPYGKRMSMLQELERRRRQTRSEQRDADHRKHRTQRDRDDDRHDGREAGDERRHEDAARHQTHRQANHPIPPHTTVLNLTGNPAPALLVECIPDARLLLTPGSRNPRSGVLGGSVFQSRIHEEAHRLVEKALIQRQLIAEMRTQLRIAG